LRKRRSDFISIHVPLTPETNGLIGAREFAMMKPTAVFVNASRGAVVDQTALYEALCNGKIFSAGIDVTQTEPIPMDDPLLGLPNLVIAPHIGSASFATRQKMAAMAVENLLAGLKGMALPYAVN
jgi:glyoxylate reductase